jgi:hypothetical protein
LEHTKARLPWFGFSVAGGFISVKVLGLFEGAVSMENCSFHTALLQWQEMSGCNHHDYCARFGKQHLEWVLI